MKRIALLALGFAAAFEFALAAPATPPRKAEIVYQVIANGVPIAEVTQNLEHDGRSYRLTENWKGKGAFALKGNATRTSRGVVATDGLRPQQFEDKRAGRDPLQVTFDPAAKTPTLKQQDQLSLLWTFAFAPPSKLAAVEVADGKNVSHYVFQPAGKEKVKTPAGEFNALKFVKKRDHPDDKATELWLSIDKRIPVRLLVIDKNGAKIDQLAARISTQ
jgi:hypothetical protein